MKIKNVGKKALGFGIPKISEEDATTLTVLPGETIEVPDNYKGHAAFEIFAKKGLIEIVSGDAKSDEQKAAKEVAEAKAKAKAEAAAAEEKARLEAEAEAEAARLEAEAKAKADEEAKKAKK